MNILLLMAGPSTDFREAGYSMPKSLFEIDGRPMVEHVLDNISSIRTAGNRLLCLINKQESTQNYVGDVVTLLEPTAHIINVEPTAGAACTALLAIDNIDNTEPLLIINGDQILNHDLVAITKDFEKRMMDGGIVVFKAVHPRWSYAKVDEEGFVVEVAEKRPISRLATAGIYYFARGQEFVQAAMQMIKKDANVGGLFYISTVYNEMLLKGARVGIYEVRREEYFSLKTPKDAFTYEDQLQLRKTKAGEANA